jgi:hypothetical protein
MANINRRIRSSARARTRSGIADAAATVPPDGIDGRTLIRALYGECLVGRTIA